MGYRKTIIRTVASVCAAAALSLSMAQGLFAEEQVGAGSDVYKAQCQVCHGDKLLSGEMGGPPLSGAFFFNRWEGKTLGEFYEYIHDFMPFGQGGLLSKTEYSDVVAFILDYNGFAAGETAFSPDSDLAELVIAKPAAD